MRWPTVVLIAVVVLLSVYAAAVGMFSSPRPPAWLAKRPIAHRGQWSEGAERPENSLPAFERAASNGLGIELDVHRTRDGELVIVHDDDLETMTGEAGKVGDLTLEQVKRRRLAGGAESPPTLTEALRAVRGRVPIFVEIKNEGDVGPLEDEVARQLSSYDGEVAVMSFNPFSLARVAQAAPKIPRGQLSGSFDDEGLKWYEVFLLRHLLMNWKSRPDFIAYELKELPSAETSFQKWRGRPLLAWTAQTREDAETARRVADGVIGNPGAFASQ